MANSKDPYEMPHNDISPEPVLFAKAKLKPVFWFKHIFSFH